VARFLSGQHLDYYLWRWILWLALFTNIMEAVVVGMLDGDYPNGVAGLCLILLMPRAYFTCTDPKIERRLMFFTFLQPSFQHVVYVDNSPEVGYYDLVYETGWDWVFLYTTWNACFSFDDRRDHFISICVVLVAALYGNADPKKPWDFFRVRGSSLRACDLTPCLQIDPHMYIQGRCATLYTRYVILAYYDVYQEVSGGCARDNLTGALRSLWTPPCTLTPPSSYGGGSATWSSSPASWPTRRTCTPARP